MVQSHQRVAVHGMTQSLIWILLIVMSVYLTDRVIYYQLGKIGPERTRWQTLRAVIRFAVQAVGVLLILLVILGTPSQMPTILGLAGAGLTVALKDFVAPARTLALAGETMTVTFDPEGGVVGLELDELFVVPVQPASSMAASRNTGSSERRKTDLLTFAIDRSPERRRPCAGWSAQNYASPRAGELLYGRTKSGPERRSRMATWRIV